MGLREIRRHLRKERQSAIRRFRKQKRLNSMASPGRHDFIIVLDHLKPAFNIGKIFRSADAFGVATVRARRRQGEEDATEHDHDNEADADDCCD